MIDFSKYGRDGAGDVFVLPKEYMVVLDILYLHPDHNTDNYPYEEVIFRVRGIQEEIYHLAYLEWV